MCVDLLGLLILFQDYDGKCLCFQAKNLSQHKQNVDLHGLFSMDVF